MLKERKKRRRAGLTVLAGTILLVMLVLVWPGDTAPAVETGRLLPFPSPAPWVLVENISTKEAMNVFTVHPDYRF